MNDKPTLQKPTLEEPALEGELEGEEEPIGLEPDAEGPAVGRGLIPEGVKKALLAGVGALFMTEEGARRLAREWKLPKDVIGFIGQQASSAKDEILRVLSDEIRHFLESEVVRRELGKALESMTVEVNAEIRLRRDQGGAAHPEVKASVRPRRAPRRTGHKGKR